MNFKVSVYTFCRGRQSKRPLKENGIASFISKDNANNFCWFFSNLADSLLQTLPGHKNEFGINTTEEHYKQIQNECGDLNLHNAM